VWRGVRDRTGAHHWARFTNGLPPAIVQDLHTWSDPSGSTRLLRAALASRGLWEVDLGADARRETWIRATPFDDRRAALASALDPTNPSADLFGDESLMASPDIVVRPAWPVTEPPQFPGDLVSDLGPEDDIGLGTNFNLWTFQTAFRWQHPSVAWVSYPGLPGDRYHNLAKKYAPNGAGAVFTFGLKGGYDAGIKLVSNVKLFSHLANIGDTRSLIIHPASTTHRQLSDAQKVQAGAGPDVVRLSIGLEDTADIIGDLEQALEAA